MVADGQAIPPQSRRDEGVGDTLDRRWKVVFFCSAIGIVTFTVLGLIGAPQWTLVAALVAFLALTVVVSLVAATGSEPACTTQEAAEVLGISEEKVGFLLADAVLKPQRSPSGESWGVTVASVERERRYRENATPGRRLLRSFRRVLLWMP